MRPCILTSALVCSSFEPIQDRAKLLRTRSLIYLCFRKAQAPTKPFCFFTKDAIRLSMNYVMDNESRLNF